MKRTIVLSMTLGLLAAGVAVARGAEAESATSAQGKMQVAGAAAGHAGSAATASAEADGASRAKLDAIVARGARASEKERARTEARLAAAADRVDRVAGRGEGEVAARLAAEFGVAADVLTAEKTDWKIGWGELMIAHTLAASATAQGITVAEIVDLRADGTGWGQIAAGLEMSLGAVVGAVRSEARVASGEVRADGSVAAIRGERSVAAGASASAAARGGLGTGSLGAGASAASGASVTVPRIRIGH
jgi:hypothetical protein